MKYIKLAGIAVMDTVTSITKSPTTVEKKVKIHLPISFQQAINCSEEKKEKILLSQAKRIGHLQEWEIKALLRLCNEKEQEEGKKGNWLKKGMVNLVYLKNNQLNKN